MNDMKARRDTPEAKLDSIETPGKQPWTVQLRQSVKGLSFEEGRAALSPSQFGVQKKPAASRSREANDDKGNGSPVQPKVAGAGRGSEGVKEAAAQGTAGSAQTMPHLDAIQRSFGGHDVSNVQAHVGGRAAEASKAMGAEAYTTGNKVAFKASPDLHTAAHEAAHVVQQRGGVSLKGGVGRDGDHYERLADAVATRVVEGKPAGDLLGPCAADGGAEKKSLQTRRSPKQRGAITCRVVRVVTLKDGKTQVTMNRGKEHGVRRGWSAELEAGSFEITKVTDRECVGSIAATPDEITANPAVTLRATRRRKRVREPVAGRITNMVLTGDGRTLITINRGEKHGLNSKWWAHVDGYSYRLTALTAGECVAVVDFGPDELRAIDSVDLRRRRGRKTHRVRPPRAAEKKKPAETPGAAPPVSEDVTKISPEEWMQKLELEIPDNSWFDYWNRGGSAGSGVLSLVAQFGQVFAAGLGGVALSAVMMTIRYALTVRRAAQLTRQAARGCGLAWAVDYFDWRRYRQAEVIDKRHNYDEVSGFIKSNLAYLHERELNAAASKSVEPHFDVGIHHGTAMMNAVYASAAEGARRSLAQFQGNVPQAKLDALIAKRAHKLRTAYLERILSWRLGLEINRAWVGPRATKDRYGL